jgi:hypothetical protein
VKRRSEEKKRREKIASSSSYEYETVELKIDVLRGLILLRPQGPISSMWVT